MPNVLKMCCFILLSFSNWKLTNLIKQLLNFRSQLSNLQPVQLTELEAEFAKLDKEKMIPSRYIRSEQAKKAIMSTQNEVVEGIFYICADT